MVQKQQHRAQAKNACGIKNKSTKTVWCDITIKKKTKKNIHVIDFDPRPKEFPKVTSKNKFVVDLQALSADQNNVSMWETQLLITYEDADIKPSSVPFLKEKR